MFIFDRDKSTSLSELFDKAKKIGLGIRVVDRVPFCGTQLGLFEDEVQLNKEGTYQIALGKDKDKFLDFHNHKQAWQREVQQVLQVMLDYENSLDVVLLRLQGLEHARGGEAILKALTQVAGVVTEAIGSHQKVIETRNTLGLLRQSIQKALNELTMVLHAPGE